MKTYSTVVAILICLSIQGFSKESPAKKIDENNEVRLSKVLMNINKAFEEALNAEGQYQGSANILNYLTKVNLTFSETITKEGGIEGSIFVKLGRKRTKEKTKSLSHTFKPRKSEKIAANKDIVKKQYQDVYNELLSIGTCLDDYRELPYQIQELELEISFTLTKSTEVGVEFEISTVKLGGSGSKAKAATNKMTLTFEFPDSFFQHATK